MADGGVVGCSIGQVDAATVVAAVAVHFAVGDDGIANIHTAAIQVHRVAAGTHALVAVVAYHTMVQERVVSRRAGSIHADAIVGVTICN